MLYRKICIFLIILAGLYAAQPVQKSPANNYKVQDWIQINAKVLNLLAEADKYYQKGNYGQAVKNYQTVLGFNPDDQKTKDKLSRAKTADGLTADIVNNYNISQYQELLSNIKDLGELNAQDKNYQDYQSKAQKILNNLNAGDELFAKAQYNEAINNYEKVLHINPADNIVPEKIKTTREILSVRKQAMQNYVSGKYGEAKKNFQTIINYNSADQLAQDSIKKCNQIIAYITEADKYFRDYDFTNAVTYLNKVVEINPDDKNTIKRTADYQKIINYYANNNFLLKNSFYPEVIYNYKNMLKILPNNEILSKELLQYEQCQLLKNKAKADFVSENYAAAYDSFAELLDYNKLDGLVSANQAVVRYALALQEKATSAYRGGDYTRSLTIYKQIANLKLQENKSVASDWTFYRGKESPLELDLKQQDPVHVTVVFNEKQKLKMNGNPKNTWQGSVLFPADTLEGYNTAKIYVETAQGQKQLFFVPYLIKEQIVLSPAGYLETEKDLVL